MARIEDRGEIEVIEKTLLKKENVVVRGRDNLVEVTSRLYESTEGRIFVWFLVEN